MPLSSRNFVVSAIPFIPTDAINRNVRTEQERNKTKRRLPRIIFPIVFATPNTRCMPVSVLVFSSSFLHGSFCPELIASDFSLTGDRPSEPVPGLTSFCFENSSTIQFINSVKIHPQSAAALSQLIAQSRYFTRQLVELHQVTDVSAALNAPLRNLNALKKLTLTFDPDRERPAPLWIQVRLGTHRQQPRQVPPDVDNLLDEHLSRLYNLENLEISRFYSGASMTSKTLPRIWAINPMRYLTNFKIAFSDDSAEIDLSVISEAQPRLQKLHVDVNGRNESVLTTVILPTLAVMGDLREISLMIAVRTAQISWSGSSDDEDDENSAEDAIDNNNTKEGMQHLINTKKKKYYCPHLTEVDLSLHEKIATTREDVIKYFVNKLDGSRVTDAYISYLGGACLRNPIRSGASGMDADDVKVLAPKFPLLARVHLKDQDSIVESLKLIGLNLKEGSLTEELMIDLDRPNKDRNQNVDEGISYLFDPRKATGGCYKSLNSLWVSAGAKIRGKGWFGESLYTNEAFLQKQFVLRRLHLEGDVTTRIDGFNEILLAFSHCLEQLEIDFNFPSEGFVSSEELFLRKMVRLDTLHLTQRLNAVSALGSIVALCSKLRTVTVDGIFTDEYVERFCDNFVESEARTLEIEVKEFPKKMLQSSWDRLAKIASLREIRVWTGLSYHQSSSKREEDEEEHEEEEEEENFSTDEDGMIKIMLLLSKFRQERPDVRIIESYMRY